MAPCGCVLIGDVPASELWLVRAVVVVLMVLVSVCEMLLDEVDLRRARRRRSRKGIVATTACFHRLVGRSTDCLVVAVGDSRACAAESMALKRLFQNHELGRDATSGCWVVTI